MVPTPVPVPVEAEPALPLVSAEQAPAIEPETVEPTPSADAPEGVPQVIHLPGAPDDAGSPTDLARLVDEVADLTRAIHRRLDLDDG